MQIKRAISSVTSFVCSSITAPLEIQRGTGGFFNATEAVLGGAILGCLTEKLDGKKWG